MSRFIYFRCGKWSVEIRGKLLGRYITLDEAIRVRNSYLKGLQMDMVVEDMQELKDKIMGLEAELKEVVNVLLKVSPEHRNWLEANFGNYLDE